MSADDLTAALTSIKGVYGLPAWGADVGYGSFLTMDFGAQASDPSRPRGAYHLWIYLASWRIESATEVLVSCEDDDLGSRVSFLNGHAIEKITIEPLSLSTVFELTGGLRLVTFSVYTDGGEHWMLFLPDGNVFTAGPGATWSLEPAATPPAGG